MQMLLEYIRAFVVGGIFCVIAQVLIDRTKLTPARILVGYVVGGVILGAFGWYQPIVDFAGAGATIPLSGFGHLLMQGVKEAVGEEGLKGVFTGGLTAASMGITVAMLMGFTMALIFQPKG